MRVLQVGYCCGGTPFALADATGGAVLKFSDRPHPLGYRAEREISLAPVPDHLVISQWLSTLRFLRVVEEYDLLHFHCSTMLPLFADLPLWKRMGKVQYLHFHGSDIRGAAKSRYIPRLAASADRLLVSTPDLLQYCPGSEWVPQLITDLERIPYSGTSNDHDAIRILHAPTVPERKGTPIIQTAVRELSKCGIDIEYRQLTGVSHETVLEAVRWADVVIDQVRPDIGCYGNISIEAMATGKPVICSIAEAYKSVYRGCPILPVRSADPSEVREHISTLADDPALSRDLGREGREYVDRMHSLQAVVKQLYGGPV